MGPGCPLFYYYYYYCTFYFTADDDATTIVNIRRRRRRSKLCAACAADSSAGRRSVPKTTQGRHNKHADFAVAAVLPTRRCWTAGGVAAATIMTPVTARGHDVAVIRTTYRRQRRAARPCR